MMEQQSITKILLIFLLSMVGAKVSAYDIAVENADGVTIYYNYINDGTELEVTSASGNGYIGSVDIPEKVTYMGKTLKVTSIGGDAFSSCYRLTSIKIPNSVTSIGSYAFIGCWDISVYIEDLAAWCKIKIEGTDSNPLSRARNLYLNGEEINDLVIPSSVTNIGDRAFSCCTFLTSITIPNSVTNIGNSSFSGCSSLTSVSIGNGVTSIGEYAFSGCSGLTSVAIPTSVKSIGGFAFYGCSALSSVTIGSSVTSIGENAFCGCSSLTAIVVEKENAKYDSRNNCNAIIETSSNTLISGCKNTTIPNSVTSIGYGAFWSCTGLNSIAIPGNVTSIGEYAFSDCSDLTSVIIGNGVTSIGGMAFHYCSGLTSVTIPNSVTNIKSWAFVGCSGLTSVTIGNSVTNIGEGAFENCSNLTSITIPSSVANIGEAVFGGCSALTSIYVEAGNTKYDSRNDCNAIIETQFITLIAGCKNTTIPNNVFKIGNRAFERCTGLTSITIPNSVQIIGSYAFQDCSNLIEVISMIENPYSINKNTFSDNAYTNATLLVPKGSVAKYKATQGWNKFVEIIDSVPSTVAITDGAMTIHVATAGTLPYLISESDKYSIEELTLTGELNGTDFRLLRDMAGSNYLGQITNGKLRVLDFSGANIVAGGKKYLDTTNGINGRCIGSHGSYQYDITDNNEVPQMAFYGCNLEEVSISNTATSIGDEAFSYCCALTSMTIGNSVVSIGKQMFTGCNNLTSLIVSSGNTKYDSRNNCNAIIETSSNTLLAGCNNTVIPSGVTSIGNSAFFECHGFTSITIPNSVTRIGESAFFGCYSLTSITIPRGVTSIGDDAFQGCNSLTSITIPNSVTTIGNSAFANCSSLTSIMIPSSVTIIENGAFIDCRGLTSIKVEAGNTKYDSRNNCNAIIETESNTLIVGCQNTIIPNSVTRIGDLAFASCIGLTSITIPSSVSSIGDDAFFWCKGLTSITIPGSVLSIGKEAFWVCPSLTSITIGNGVTSIGSYAFQDCSNLIDVISMIENPFPINRNTFSDNAYTNATLLVPTGTIDKYKATEGWKEFVNIKESGPSVIKDKEIEDAKELRRYSLDGRVVQNSRKGINIIQMDDGTTKKILVK